MLSSTLPASAVTANPIAAAMATDNMASRERPLIGSSLLWVLLRVCRREIRQHELRHLAGNFSRVRIQSCHLGGDRFDHSERAERGARHHGMFAGREQQQ